VPIYVLVNDGRAGGEAARFARTWPDAAVVARYARPGGHTAIVVYRLPAPRAPPAAAAAPPLPGA
jgi:hypothetical protein